MVCVSLNMSIDVNHRVRRLGQRQSCDMIRFNGLYPSVLWGIAFFPEYCPCTISVNAAHYLPQALQLLHPPLHLLHPPQPHLQLLLLILKPQPPLRIQRAKEISALAVKLQYPPVIPPQAPSMRHRHQRHAEPLCGIVHGSLDHERHARRALVQYRVAGRVVEEAGHCDALLEADGQGRRPLVFCIPAAGALDQVGDVDCGEVFEQVCVGNALCAHLAEGVGVDELLAEGAAGEVGALRDVGD